MILWCIVQTDALQVASHREALLCMVLQWLCKRHVTSVFKPHDELADCCNVSWAGSRSVTCALHWHCLSIFSTLTTPWEPKGPATALRLALSCCCCHAAPDSARHRPGGAGAFERCAALLAHLHCALQHSAAAAGCGVVLALQKLVKQLQRQPLSTQVHAAGHNGLPAWLCTVT